MDMKKHLIHQSKRVEIIEFKLCTVFTEAPLALDAVKREEQNKARWLSLPSPGFSCASAPINQNARKGLSTLLAVEVCQKRSCVCSLSINSHCLRQTDAVFLDVNHLWKDLCINI